MSASVVKLIDIDPLDDFGKLWAYLMRGMDNSPLSQAEKLGCIEFVKHEILANMLPSKEADE